MRMVNEIRREAAAREYVVGVLKKNNLNRKADAFEGLATAESTVYACGQMEIAPKIMRAAYAAAEK